MKSTSNVMGGPSGGGDSSHQTTRKVSKENLSINQKGKNLSTIFRPDMWRFTAHTYWLIWLSVYSRVQPNRSSSIDASSKIVKITWQDKLQRARRFLLLALMAPYLTGPINRTISAPSEPSSRLCKLHNTTLLVLANIQVPLELQEQHMQLFLPDRQTWSTRHEPKIKIRVSSHEYRPLILQVSRVTI